MGRSSMMLIGVIDTTLPVRDFFVGPRRALIFPIPLTTTAH